jgi:uncharacterized protein YxeA
MESDKKPGETLSDTGAAGKAAADEDKKKGSRQTKILIAVIIVLVIVIIGLVVFFFFRSPEKEKEVSDKPTLITEDNVDQVIGDLEDDSADTMFNCRMTYSWSFNGKKSTDAYVANTDYNHYPIYFQVRDDDSEEIIYESATIPVGSEVNGITLDKKLSMGTHPATVIYHLVDEDGEEVSTTAFTITIQVVGN